MPTHHPLLSRLAAILVGSAVIVTAAAGPALASDGLPNRAPVAQRESAATTVGQPVVIDVLANDTDPDGDALTVTSVGTSYIPGTTITIGADSKLTYTAGQRPGWDNFPYTISDGRGGQSTVYIAVAVAALDTEADDPPLAAGDSVEALEGHPVTVAVLANDLDVDGPALTVTSVTQPPAQMNGSSSGTVVRNADHTVTYTPPAGGLASSSYSVGFSYTMSDGTNSSTGSVNISFRGVNGPENDAPLAASDNAVTVQSQPVTVAVLANDMDVDGDPLRLTGATMGYPGGSGPSNGTVSADLDAGTVTYTPPTTVSPYSYPPYGTSFSYTVADGRGGTATGQVYINILAEDPAIDDPPRPGGDSAVTTRNTPVTIDVLANDIDADTPAGGLTVTVSGMYPSPTSPTVVVNPDKTITFTPAPGATGSQSFSYTLADATSSASGYVNVEVLAVDGPGNDAPVGQQDSLTVLQNRAATLAVLANDYDFDGDPLRVSGLRASSYGPGPDASTVTTYNGGTATVAPSGSAILYTPRAGYTGSESFTYTVSDGQGGSATVSVYLTVAPVETANKRPILAADAAHVVQGQSVVVRPLDNDFDPDGDRLTITSTGYAYQGTVTVTDDGQSLTYQAPATWSGSAYVSFSVSDGEGHTEPGNVDIYVHMADNPSANDPPRAASDNAIGSTASPVTIDVLANDFDIDTPRSGLTVTIPSPPYGGSATVNDQGVITYSPAPGTSSSYFGFSYQLSDGANSVTGSVSGQLLTVDPAGNAAPVARYDYLSARADGTTTLAVLNNDTDVDAGDRLRITRLFSSPSDAPATTLTFWDGATAEVTEDGSAIRFTSPAAAGSWHSFSYTVSDGADASASTTVSVNTASPSTTNRAPWLVSDAAAVRRGGSVTVRPLANDFDPDGDSLTIDSASASGATVTLSADRQSLAVSPSASSGPGSPPSGSLWVNYSVRDGRGLVSSSSIDVTVVLADDPSTNEPTYTASDSAVSTGGPVTLDVLANDFDIDTDRSRLTMTVSGSSYPNLIVRNADQTVTFTPTPGSFGSSGFSYTVFDGTNSATGWANVEVLGMDRPGNDTPVARDDYNLAMLTGTSRVLPVLANDYDFDAGDTLRITGLQRSSYDPAGLRITTYSGGIAEVTEDGTGIRLTPGTTGYPSTSEGFSYTVSDGQASVTRSVSVALITGGNRAPTTGYDSVMVGEGSTVVIEPLVNDYDPEGDPLQIVSAYGYTGTVTVSDDGQRLNYRAGSTIGSTSISYTVSDGQGHTTMGSVSVFVHPVNHAGNDAPQARADNTGVYAGGTVTIPVLANDFDIDGDTLTVSRVAWPQTSGYGTTGRIEVGADGRSVVYTATVPAVGPPPSYAYFQYEVSDGQGGTDTEQVSVNIYQRNTAGNEPPTANSDSAVTTAGVSVTIAVPANDTDIDGDTLTVTAVTPNPGEAANAEISADGRSIVYTPPADPALSGQSFQYTISDGHGGTASGYAWVMIMAADDDGNDAPLARYDYAATHQGRSVRIPVLVNDVDFDGDSLAIESVVSQPAHGSVTVDGDELVYTPRSAFAGYDSLRYQVTDGTLSSEATVSIQVEFYNQPGNDAPVTTGYGASTLEDHAVTVDVATTAVDYEHDPISLVAVGTPLHGTAEIVSGRIRYTPAPAFLGQDQFTYVVTDGELESEPAVVDVYVSADPNAQQVPVASGAELTTDEDTPLAGTFAADDGADADPITYVVVDEPDHGRVEVGADGAFTYTPAAGYSGADAISFLARDADGESAPATVSITVRARNDAPAVSGHSAIVASGAAFDIDVLAGASDPDGDTLTVTATSDPAHGQAGIVTGGRVRYTSDAGFTGTDSFTYTVSDGRGGSATGTVSVEVARQAVEVVAGAGETVVSGPAATPEIPVTIAVTSPSGGLVSIVENTATESLPGYTLVGSQITIEAPAASADDPLRLVFRLDRAVLEAHGGSVDTVTVFRNGAPAGNCPGSTTANPDPCVTSRIYDAATNDVVLTVLAVHASEWALGVALPSTDPTPTPDPGPPAPPAHRPDHAATPPCSPWSQTRTAPASGWSRPTECAPASAPGPSKSR